MSDRFDSMRSKGINTFDATASANDIAEGKTAYVAGRKITGTGQGGGTGGILPMPINSLQFMQKAYARGTGTVRLGIPENCTSVDLLIKEEGYPSSQTDYDQKITLDNPQFENQISLTPKAEDGSYAYNYGMWALSKNSNGIQTAITNGNRTTFSPFYASGKFAETYVTLSNSSTWSTGSSGVVDFTQKDKFLFICSPSGLLLIDTDANTFTQLGTVACSEKVAVNVVTTDKWLVTSGSYACVFVPSTKTCTKIEGLSNRELVGVWGDYALFAVPSGYSNTTKVYKFSTDTLLSPDESHNTSLPYCFCNNEGFFFGQSNGLYKFNSTTEVFDYINSYKYYDGEGNVLTASLPNSGDIYVVVEDEYQNIWLFGNNFSGKIYRSRSLDCNGDTIY